MRIVGKKIELKLIEKNDKNDYYKEGFKNTSKEVDYFTGTKEIFSKEQIYNYIDKITEDNERYDFLILNKANKIIGEIVLNEIDFESRVSNFRIALFSEKNFNKGYGKEAIKLLLKFAFEELNLNRIELEVFDFNKRALHVYKNSGFILEGVKRQGEIIENNYVDVIIMAILKNDYENLF